MDWPALSLPFGGFLPPVQAGTNALGLASPGILFAVKSTSPPLAAGNTAAPVDTGTATYAWDSTAHIWTVGNTTGGASGISINIAGNTVKVSPYGAVPFMAGAANLAGLVIPPQVSKLVLEVYGRFGAASAYDAGRGIGLSNGASSSTIFNNTTRNIMFYRKSGAAGWTIGSADGTTQSDTSENSDTSDTSLHWFRLTWDAVAANATLHVDGTLKVTKSTNLPAIDATNTIDRFVASAPLGDATKIWEIACGMVYFI